MSTVAFPQELWDALPTLAQDFLSDMTGVHFGTFAETWSEDKPLEFDEDGWIVPRTDPTDLYALSDERIDQTDANIIEAALADPTILFGKTYEELRDEYEETP